jgi:hypothetical protein
MLCPPFVSSANRPSDPWIVFALLTGGRQAQAGKSKFAGRVATPDRWTTHDGPHGVAGLRHTCGHSHLRTAHPPNPTSGHPVSNPEARRGTTSATPPATTTTAAATTPTTNSQV